VGGVERLRPFLRPRVAVGIAIAYLVFACIIALSWYLPLQITVVPHWLEDAIYPIDKTNLDPLRVAHFVALMVVAVWLVPRSSPVLNSWVLYPAILCGQHSLEIFCLGVFLAFAGHFVMVEISGAVWMQVVISVLGILAMTSTAVLITWYKRLEGRSPGSRQKPSDADLAGGEA
jgi:hypothetical protein